MAWLRLDDGFTHHPKFEGWTAAQRWAWLEVMEYAAKYRTAGRIPRDLSLLPRTCTPRLLELAKRSGWINVDDNGDLWINDFETYNPTRPSDLEEALRQAIHDHPDASANELCRIVGGSRNQVLKLIRQYRGGTGNGTAPGTRTSIRTGIAPAYPSPSTARSGAVTTREAGEPGDDEPGPSSSEPPSDQFIDPTGGEF